MYQKLLCSYTCFSYQKINLLLLLHSLALYEPFCGFPSIFHSFGLDRSCFRGLVAWWFRGLVAWWFRGFSQVHVVVFQFPDNEEALLAIANLDTVSLTKRNPNSLDIASNAEAVLWRSLKGHVFDGNADACRPVKTVRRKIVGVQRY